MKKRGIMANVLEVISESYEFNGCGVILGYCIVKDRNTGKYYITGEEGIVKDDKGFYYEALECEIDRAGNCSRLIGNPQTEDELVYIAPIYVYGRRLGYVFGTHMIDYKG